jgi:hypothetical protein
MSKSRLTTLFLNQEYLNLLQRSIMKLFVPFPEKCRLGTKKIVYRNRADLPKLKYCLTVHLQVVAQVIHATLLGAPTYVLIYSFSITAVPG